MIDPANVPNITDDEWLARFIVNRNEYRKSDDTVKPKLFMPYKRVELSVNRHLLCTETQIWAIANDVAAKRGCALYGRADITVSSCRVEPLNVVPKALDDNPNHANVIGFPERKEDQQSLAIKLAAESSKRLAPPN